MSEFHDELREWFISMGYPLDEVDQTDWKTLCCGKLTLFWKDIMSVLHPKQTVTNIKMNILLKEITEYMKRENTSAAKLGIVLPPPQIQYRQEQDKLKKELDNLKIELQIEKHNYKLKMEERKRKCLQLHETKQEVMETERKIYLMRETMDKLKNEVHTFRKRTDSLKQCKGYFASKSGSFEENLNVKEKFIETLQECDTNIESLNKPSDDKSVIHNVPTSHLLDLVLDYQKDLPKTLNRDMKFLTEKHINNLKVTADDGDCFSLKKGLSNIELFHCQLVIASLNNKKESQKLKKLIPAIKTGILEQLSGDDTKIEMFHQELAQIGLAAYNNTVEEELTDLMSRQGFYSKFINNNSLKNSNTKNLISRVSEEYKLLHSMMKLKSEAIVSQLELIKQGSVDVNKELVNIKDNRCNKIMWQSDYKELQDYYLKVLMKNPNLLKTESENPFECLKYLKTVINEYNMNKKLSDNANIIMNELKALPCIVENNSESLLKCSNEELQVLLNWKHMNFLQPIHRMVYYVLKRLEFKQELDNITFKNDDQVCNWPEKILGRYLDIDLKELENELLSKTMEHLPKNSSSVIKFIVSEFEEIYQFVIDYNKNKENLEQTLK